jgi:3-oxoacyl-[acyl-carrier-protein] synthase II
MTETWHGLLEGRSGVDFIKAFDASEYPVSIAGEVHDFDLGDLIPLKEAKRFDRFILFARKAAEEALGEIRLDGYAPERAGVVLGSCVGGINDLMRQTEILQERGPTRVSPWFLPNMLVDSASGQLAISLGMRGPNYAVVSACATGSQAISEAVNVIRRGDADVMLAGGTESPMTPVILAGFCAMRGLAEEANDPTRASRPFDLMRAGFVMAEGAGIVMLEELEAAKARGATIYAEVLGAGSSNDAYHMAAPEPDGDGVATMMRLALESSGVQRERVGYINAHGTSTPIGDVVETKAIRDVFGDHAYELAVSSTKSMTGHMFAAAGAVEAIVCALAIHHGVLPPTINYETPDPECDLDYVPNTAREVELDVALSNAMGLGGHNGCVLLGRTD